MDAINVSAPLLSGPSITTTGGETVFPGSLVFLIFDSTNTALSSDALPAGIDVGLFNGGRFGINYGGPAIRGQLNVGDGPGPGPGNSAPVSSFDVSPVDPTVGQEVLFDGSASLDPDGFIVRYEWDFGDGTTATGRVATHTYDSAGQFAVRLTVEDDGGLIDFTESIADVAEGSLPNLSLAGVTPTVAQVVIDPNANGDDRIDLVKGKPAVVRATVDAQGVEPGDNRGVNIVAELDGTEIATITRSLSQLVTSGAVELTFTPNQTGTADLVVRVDPSAAINESDPDDNDSEAVPIAVKVTRSHHIAFVNVSCLGPVGAADYVTTVSAAMEYIEGLFPASSSDLTMQRIDDTVVDCKGSLPRESNETWLEGKTRTGGLATRVIGIVTRSWLDSRVPPGKIGVTVTCNYPAAFSLVARWTAAAHELLHTFGWTHQTQVPFGCQQILNGSTDGLWIREGANVDVPTTGLSSLMGGAPSTVPPTFPNPEHWIGKNDYQALLAQNIVGNLSDPEVLLVSGTVDLNLNVVLAPMYRLPAGVVDEAPPGDMSIRVLDSEGNVVHEISFGVSFDVETTPTFNAVSAPFAFAVPFTETAATIEVRLNGLVLNETIIASRLLRDAVLSVPDYGFIRNAEQRRNALLNQIEA